MNISFLASANCFPRLSLLQELMCPKWSAWLLSVSLSFIRYFFCQLEKKPLASPCRQRTSLHVLRFQDLKLKCQMGKLAKSSKPHLPWENGGQSTREKYLISERPPPVFICFQFQEMMRLEEDRKNHGAKPQKLVNLLILEMGVTSVMSNTRDRGWGDWLEARGNVSRWK